MKMDNEHWVPLSHQALALLREIRTITSDSPLIFPSSLSARRPLSKGTLLNALKRIGYRGRQTAHGFRATFQTCCKEQRIALDVFDLEAIEIQLAHKRPNDSLGYDRAKLLDERRALMQRWADYLDALRSSSS